MKQHTLKTACTFQGTGLHTGRPVSLEVCPAPAGHGLVFQRTDLPGAPCLPALAANVGRTRRSTLLQAGRAKVRTPEHLLSALYALGVDNALLRLDAEEVPILDGSARPFAEAFLAAGLEAQDADRKPIIVTKPFVYADTRSGSTLRIDPAEDFSVEVTVDYPSRVVGVQRARFDAGTDFAAQVAPSRTFCFKKEVWMMRLTGLIRGGSLDNALVIDEPRGYVGDPALHFDNEPARHKLLDLMGDLSLAGRPIRGRVQAYKPGHRFNARALQLFLATPCHE